MSDVKRAIKMVTVRHLKNNRLDIEVPTPGKKEPTRLIFGSALDHGIVGARAPEIEVPLPIWNRAKRMPAVAQMLADNVLTTYGG